MDKYDISYGDGDPQIATQAQKAHDLAQVQGLSTYCDPETGFSVCTANFLQKQGSCCGNGCRHCPFDASEQRRAQRPRVRST